MAKLSVPVGETDHIQGPASAPVTLVEYGDYQCPSCGEAFSVVGKLQDHFGDKLRFVFRNFPLPQHEMATPAAEAAEYAGSKGKFWEMHDALYENQDHLSDELFPQLAGDLGLDAKAMTRAIKDEAFTEKIEADLESGEDSGLQGTPTFYINGQQYDGGLDAASLTKAIEAAGAK